jgi:hypothetical protein
VAGVAAQVPAVISASGALIMSAAPIALFVYKRLDHTRRTVEALLRNVGSADADLHVFSDGPANEAAAAEVAAVRQYLHSIQGFRSIEIVERETNLGLAASIIQGVTRLCAERGRVIVVEDDLLTSRWFLKYLNDGLDLYADDSGVASIHAYLPPIGRRSRENFFLLGADCWGWATWQRAWKDFVPDANILLQEVARSPNRRYFDYIGKLPHTSMLRGYIARRNNSWAIRWHSSMFVRSRLTMHPSRTLVNNIGLDGSGTHCSENDDMNVPIIDDPLAVSRVPMVHSVEDWKLFRREFRMRMFRRLIGRILR